MSAQSSFELDTGQGDLIDETIKQVMHKLHQTIVTTDIDNFNLDRARCAIPNKPITIPSLVNLEQDRIMTPQFHKMPNLQPTSLDQGTHITYNKLNQAPEVYNAPTLSLFKETKQIIMDIDRLSHSITLHNQIMESLNQKG